MGIVKLACPSNAGWFVELSNIDVRSTLISLAVYSFVAFSAVMAAPPIVEDPAYEWVCPDVA